MPVIDSILGAALGGAARGAAVELGAASAIGQGNRPMVDHLRAQAIPRIGVWLALALWTIARAVHLITGEGLDPEFRDVAGAETARIVAIAIALGLGVGCVLAARRTYRVERRPPPPGTLWFPGYRLPLFGEWFMDLVGGLLLLVGFWAFTTVPESYAAGQSAQFRNYASAGATTPIGLGVVMSGIGFLCLIARRSRWDLSLGQPLVRRAITAFSPPRPRGDRIALRWEDYWMGQGVTRRRVAWVLRATIDTRNAFEVAFAPVATTVEERARLGEMWRQVLSRTVTVTGVDPGPGRPA